MITSSVVLLMLGWQTADVGLARADLPAYAAAFQSIGVGRPVLFGDLWNEEKKFRGQIVQVQGRAVRVFRTDAIGDLPARTEVWLATRSGDLICVVYPTSPRGNALTGRSVEVRFEGTSLGKITYGSGDVPRLAPLVVGPHPPQEVSIIAVAPRSPPAGDRSDWIVAAVLGAMAMGVLIRRSGRRRPDSVFDRQPAPEFVDGEE